MSRRSAFGVQAAPRLLALLALLLNPVPARRRGRRPEHGAEHDEQCEDVDDPEDCYSVVSHVNAVAGWSSFFAGLVFFPTLVWVALLFAVPDLQVSM